MKPDPDFPIAVITSEGLTGNEVVIEDLMQTRLAPTSTPPAVLPGLVDGLPVTVYPTDNSNNLAVTDTVTAAPTRTAYWATDYVTRSALLTREWAMTTGSPIFTATSPPLHWIATQGAVRIIVVTAPPEIYVTEVYVNVPAPYPVVVTAAPTRTPSPTAIPIVVPTLSPMVTETPTPSVTPTLVYEVTAEVTSEATFEVTLEP